MNICVVFANYIKCLMCQDLYFKYLYYIHATDEETEESKENTQLINGRARI